MKNFTTKSAFLKSTCQNVKTLKIDELYIKKLNDNNLFSNFIYVLNAKNDTKLIFDEIQIFEAQLDKQGVIKISQSTSDDKSALTPSLLKKEYDDGCVSISDKKSKVEIKKMSQLTNINYLFYNNDKIITIKDSISPLVNSCNSTFMNAKFLTSFDCSLANLIEAESMFYGCDSLISYNGSLVNLTNGTSMFNSCSSLQNFNCVSLDNLICANYMFVNCKKLNSFNYQLNNLVQGYSMFYNCSSLKGIDTPLPKLETGSNMFCGCSSLTSFNTPLSNLTVGMYMFKDCTSLTSFNGSLEKLTDGTHMFRGCTSLTSFNGSLASLTEGWGIFNGCKLDLASVQTIASTIKDISSNGLPESFDIGISSSIKGNSSLNAALNTIQNKGWSVFATYN